MECEAETAFLPVARVTSDATRKPERGWVGQLAAGKSNVRDEFIPMWILPIQGGYSDKEARRVFARPAL
ncbi:MAG: hypothetical protein WBW41_17000 [Verrucomicrobiia bacterium]